MTWPLDPLQFPYSAGRGVDDTKAFIPTDDCRSTEPNCHMVKFADDTVLLSLLSGPPAHHNSALCKFVEWCDNSCLERNVNKTKDMVVTFSNKWRDLTQEARDSIEIIEEYKYLGTVFNNLLKLTSHREAIFSSSIS